VVTALVLVGYAVLAAGVGPGMLRRAAWPERSPGLGILAWQALSVSAVASVLLAGVTLALPSLPTHGGLAEFLLACAVAVHDHLADPRGSVAGFVGLGVSVGLGLRVLWTLVRALKRAGRARARPATGTVHGRHPRQRRDVLVLNIRRPPLSACLAATLRSSSRPERFTRCLHTSWRPCWRTNVHTLPDAHHLVLVLAAALKAAFPWVRLFAEADAALRRLVEMRADDVALRRSSPTALAGALLRLAQGPTPEATLAAAAESAVARVRRLGKAQQTTTRRGRATVVLGSGALLVSPFVVVLASGGLCPPVAFV